MTTTDRTQFTVTEHGATAPGLELAVGDRATVIPGDETNPAPFGGRSGTVIAINPAGTRVLLDIPGHEPLNIHAIDVRNSSGRRGRSL